MYKKCYKISHLSLFFSRLSINLLYHKQTMTEPLLKFTHDTKDFTATIILKDQSQMILKVQSKLNNKSSYANSFDIYTIPDTIVCIINSGLIENLKDFYIALLSVKNSFNFNQTWAILEVQLIFCHKRSIMEIPVEKDFQIPGESIHLNSQAVSLGEIPEEFNEPQNQIKKNNGEIYYANFTNEQGKYQGQILKGLKHGQGKFFFKNGDVYTGEYYEDYRNGYGQFLYEDGEKYQGNFIGNHMYGKGKYYMKNGTICESFYKLSLAHGPGMQISPDGDITFGVYIDGVITGNLMVFFPNGDILQQPDQKFAKYYHKNGQIFEGSFKGGLKEGFGTTYWADNVKQQGNYSKDERHGEFNMIYADGKVKKSYWYNGVTCSQEKFKQQTLFESASPAPPAIEEVPEEQDEDKDLNPCPQNV